MFEAYIKYNIKSPAFDRRGDSQMSPNRYFMYEPFIDPSGPSLGSLMVYISFEKDGTSVLEPVWALKNHQGPNWMYGQARVQNDDDFLVCFFYYHDVIG